jgi:hypothetical protein
MKLKLLRKNIYGTTKYYPACPKSKVLAELAGTTTLTESALRLCGKLGYDFELVQQPFILSEI